MFNSLHRHVPEARVLDLYAGSGAMGLESISWGAGFCLFVESRPDAQKTIRSNIQHLNVDACTELWPITAEHAVARLRKQSRTFDLIICDPPWRNGISQSVHGLLGQLLTESGILVVEHPTGGDFGSFTGLRLIQRRRYGSTSVSFWTRD